MTGTNVPANDELDALRARVAQLCTELEESRRKFLELPAAKYRAFLADYSSLPESDKIYPWMEDVANKVVEAYTPPTGSPSADLFRSSQRVLCPLCGEGGEHIYGDLGFIYPEGLRRHLTGEVTARLCTVMEAAVELAKGHIARQRKGGHG